MESDNTYIAILLSIISPYSLFPRSTKSSNSSFSNSTYYFIGFSPLSVNTVSTTGMLSISCSINFIAASKTISSGVVTTYIRHSVIITPTGVLYRSKPPIAFLKNLF